MKHILFVDDNVTYGLQMQKLLTQAGYSVDLAFDTVSGIEQSTKQAYDLIISDRVMGEDDGVRFLSIIRNMDPIVKTILLTAEPTADSELEALNQYVDYYLTKEVTKQVLLKYIERVLEEPLIKRKNNQLLVSETDQIILNTQARTVTADGVEVPLRRKEFDLLTLFLSNKGIALSREEILERLWDQQYEEADERVIDVHINTLRRRLQITSIVSIRGFGYKWDE